MQEFRETVKQYVELEKQIKEMQSQIKTLKQTQQTFNENIINYMIEHNVDVCSLESEVLKLKKGSQLETINKEYINSKLKEFYNSAKITNNTQHMADLTAKYLLENRESKEKISLNLVKK
jgi:hypothetical protein